MNDRDIRAKAEKIADRPYIVVVSLDETTGGQPIYFAKSPELEGCFGQGESIEEAALSLREARIEYIKSLLEDNLPIPNQITTTSSRYVSTLTLRYSQLDVHEPSDTLVIRESHEKPKTLYIGSLKS